MKDPYQVLGVARGIDADALKQAYRKLARELHPDINPGNHKAEERFKEVSAAFDFLSDAERRAKFDRGEIDATGAPLRRSGWRSHGPHADNRANPFGGPFGGNVDDILSELLRRKEKGRAHSHPKSGKGTDLRHALTVSFAEAAAGATKRVTLVSGRTVEVRIPAATTDGQTLRLKGQGNPSPMVEGEPGDAFIEIKVAADPLFSRRELDVLIDLPVSLQEAILGGKVTVPTIAGRVTLTVPAGSNTGSVLRLKGKGIAGANGTKGDQLVTLKVVLPDNDDELKKFVEKWGPRHGYDPRSRSWGEA